MTLQDAQKALLAQLTELHSSGEAMAIADLALEAVTGWRAMDRQLHKEMLMLPAQVNQLAEITTQLLRHRPIQYILGEAWFAGGKIRVDERVLIPRPETEELVDWIRRDLKETRAGGRLLDIGTGSGCIALAVKKYLPQTEVHAMEISPGALELARSNALSWQVEINFHQRNILEADANRGLPLFRQIVSNPPYIPQREQASMDPVVLNYEPHLALFVPDEQPLLFYEAIARFGQQQLEPGGYLYLETHEKLARDVQEMLLAAGYNPTELRTDLQGKQRMVKAGKH